MLVFFGGKFHGDHCMGLLKKRDFIYRLPIIRIVIIVAPIS